MNDFVDKVVYINLAHRSDRKRQVESELLKVFPLEKILRFNAIKQEKGGIGCSMSHTNVLEMAIKNNWKNLLIVEDDLEWSNFKEGISILSELVKKPFDCIVLGGYSVNFDKKTFKLKDCCGRTAYLVSNHYYQTLLDNYKEGLELLKKSYVFAYRGDRFWNRIQRRDNWYVIVPKIANQRASFSDIEKRKVDYDNKKKTILDFLRVKK